MKNVSTSMVHIGSKQMYAFLVNRAEVGQELQGEVADGTDTQPNPKPTRQRDSNLLVLATFEKPLKTYLNNHIVSMVGARGNDPRQFT